MPISQTFRRTLRVASLLFGLWFVVHTIVILTDGLTDENLPSEIGVIPGNTVNPDGTLSPRLKARLDEGIELYRKKLVKKIIVSGGLGKEGFYEGSKMSEYLLSKGIPSEVIVVDNNGNTTGATVDNVKKLFPRAKSITVISQYFHITRTKMAFRKAGFQHVYGAHARYFEIRDLYSLMREFFGYYSYLLK